MSLPPMATVASALRKTTERLARELTNPSTEPPLWNEFEWRVARAVAAMQGVSSLLANVLRWQRPNSWLRFLVEQRAQSIARFHHIAQLLEQIHIRARRQGIALVALKGAALTEFAIYKPGERPMGDIDLLVKSKDIAATAQLLKACNYSAGSTTHRHRSFKPRATKPSTKIGEHIDNPINIEVHTRVAESLPIRETEITRHLFPRNAHAGINPYPSIASLLLHLLLHAAGNIRGRGLRLIQLHDIALLAVRMRPSDWEELASASSDARGLWWALAPLALAQHYYPTAIPHAFVASLAPGCPWLLGRVARRHRLADVSWSNIRIQAFPGIEWSKSPREAFDFALSRVWPSRAALTELNAGVDAMPLASMPWYGICHGERILRWVFSKPPRVQTMHSVRLALDQESYP
jgi:hypothetical protein